MAGASKMRWWDSRPSYIRGSVSWWEWNARPAFTPIGRWLTRRCTICGLKRPAHKMGCSRR